LPILVISSSAMFGDRLPTRLGDLHPGPVATAADLGALRLDQPLECELSQLTDRETLGQEYRFSAPVQMTRQDAERPPLVGVQVCHYTPVSLSRGGCSFPIRPAIGHQI
jgi:hypothetical protein